MASNNTSNRRPRPYEDIRVDCAVPASPDGIQLNLPDFHNMQLGDNAMAAGRPRNPSPESVLRAAEASSRDGSQGSSASTGVPEPSPPSKLSLHVRKPSVSKWQDQLTIVTHMLFYASRGDVDALRALLDAGADVNSADYDGRSAMHLAASEGKLEAVKLLVGRGAKVNPKDRWSRTPLMDAKQGVSDGKGGEYKAVVALLREKGGIELGGGDWELDPEEIDLKKARLIGKGAFGEIRKVTWRGTPVAVKMILPALSNDSQIVKEFRGEVALLMKLRHPNVVQFLAAVTSVQPLMLVTEYLPGGDLHEVIKERGPLPAPLAIGYALDIARGMNYLHNHRPESILHRDLKPRNLLRGEGNHLKVADFGLSKLVRTNSLHEMYKMTGETGSYRYMAPEVFRHEAYDRAVDVFSFAVICYEMFEGLPPFAKTLTAETVAYKVAMESVRPPFRAKTYPSGMRELIEQSWAARPSERPTFAEIIEVLERVDALVNPDRELESSSPSLQKWGLR